MGPTWPFLLMDGSHGMRHAGFRKLTVVNGTPQDRGVTMDLRFCLVGRFLTNKPINFVAMKTTMTSVLAPGKGLTVSMVGAGQYMVWLLGN